MLKKKKKKQPKLYMVQQIHEGLTRGREGLGVSWKP